MDKCNLQFGPDLTPPEILSQDNSSPPFLLKIHLLTFGNGHLIRVAKNPFLLLMFSSKNWQIKHPFEGDFADMYSDTDARSLDCIYFTTRTGFRLKTILKCLRSFNNSSFVCADLVSTTLWSPLLVQPQHLKLPQVKQLYRKKFLELFLKLFPIFSPFVLKSSYIFWLSFYTSVWSPLQSNQHLKLPHVMRRYLKKFLELYLK